jgi:hypothetical protein
LPQQCCACCMGCCGVSCSLNKRLRFCRDIFAVGRRNSRKKSRSDCCCGVCRVCAEPTTTFCAQDRLRQ